MFILQLLILFNFTDIKKPTTQIALMPPERFPMTLTFLIIDAS